MPAFEIKLKDEKTGNIRIARVSSFVVKNNSLFAISNVKNKCDELSAKQARIELENFISFIKIMQKNKRGDSFKTKDGEIKISDIEPDKVKLITIGPKGCKKVGFDEELDYTETELEELEKSLKEISK